MVYTHTHTSPYLICTVVTLYMLLSRIPQNSSLFFIWDVCMCYHLLSLQIRLCPHARQSPHLSHLLISAHLCTCMLSLITLCLDVGLFLGFRFLFLPRV